MGIARGSGRGARWSLTLTGAAVISLGVRCVGTGGAVQVPPPPDEADRAHPSSVDCGWPASRVVTLSGAQVVYDRRRHLTDSTVIDAQAASWIGDATVPIRFGGGTAICLVGALVQGTFPDSTSWATMHDTYAIQPFGPRAVVRAVRVRNYGDGILPRAGADGWVLRDSWLSFIRDDCIENDNMLNGLVENVLFDGCYVFYSARRPSSATPVDGSANTVTFRNVLARLQPMPTVYAGTAPGHGRFWKLDPRGGSPAIVLENVVFRVDQRSSIGGRYMRMIPPSEKLAGCVNVVLVWLGDGEFPEPIPGCYTLTRDRAVWDSAVVAWRAAHPGMRDTVGAEGTMK